MRNIGFIGAGNMGSALATAAADAVSGKNIYIADIDQQKAQAVAEKIGAHAVSSEEACAVCDMLYLAVKPQMLPTVCPPLAQTLKNHNKAPLIVTMAAGTEIQAVKQYFPFCHVLRIMPNTPVSVGSGVVLYDTVDATAQEEEFFLTASEFAGTVIKMPESDIDAASVISGCGPAFVFLFLDAIAKAGEKTGLSRDVALQLCANTLIGASKLFLASDSTPEALCTAVCSSGGSTIEGVKKFRELDLDAMCEKAVKASFDRTKELGKK